MKITVPAKTFATEVAWAARHLPHRPAVPVLAGLRLTATDDSVEVAVFDYETAARTRFDATRVTEPGTVLVAGRLLASIATQLPAAADLTLHTDGATLHLDCGTGTYELLTLPLDDYPDLPDVGATIGTVDGPALAEACGRTTVAARRDDALPMLMNMHLAFTAERMTLQATDRYRLSRQHLDWAPADGERPDEVLVEAARLTQATKHLASGPVEITVIHAEDGAAASLGLSASGRSLVLRLADTGWPDVDRVLAGAGEDTVATASAARLAETVKRVALFADANCPVVLDLSAEAITVHTAGHDGAGSEQVPAACSGHSRQLHFNPRFLLDALSCLPGPELRLTAGAENNLSLFSADGDETYLHLLVAIRPL